MFKGVYSGREGYILWEGRIGYICLIGVYSEKEGYILGGSHVGPICLQWGVYFGNMLYI